MYSIKNFKTFKGHEGEPCAQGTLHGPAGKVADWSDDSNGGCMRVDFVSKKAEADFVDFAKTYLADKKDYDGALYQTATLGQDYLIENAISDMSYIIEENKELLKFAKQGIAFFVKDDTQTDGKCLKSVKIAYTTANVAALREKYPDLLEIVNERLGLPLTDEAQFNLAEQNKRYRKLSKTVTLFSIRDADGNLKVMQSKAVYSTALAKRLRESHPNLVEIINERFL